MSKSTDNAPIYSAVQRREAAEWFVIIHDKESPETGVLQAWLEWLEESEGNKAAFEAVAAAWHAVPVNGMRGAARAGEEDGDTYDVEIPVSQWMREREEWKRAQGRERGKGRRRAGRMWRRWSAGAAAGIVVLAAGLLVMFHLQKLGNAGMSDEYSTRVGEKIELMLNDGSRVWLGPLSTLRIDFSSAARDIQLLSGEAFFSVKKDPIRPFIVHSPGGDVTAVGTAFNVRDVGGHIMVAVSEGVVTVTPGGDVTAPEEVVRVESGHQVVYTPRSPAREIEVVRSMTSGERARWVDGVLIYRDEPLGDVIQDVSRYSQKPIELRDPLLAGLRYSGVVYVESLDEWIDALSESFPLRMDEEEGRKILHMR